MGRKPAPQPLALAAADTTTPGHGQRPGETLRIVSPAADSRSPRSPRSPFRFATKKAHQAQQGAGAKTQPLHVADLVQQPRSASASAGDDEAHYLPASSASVSPPANQPSFDDPRRYQNPQQQQHQHQHHQSQQQLQQTADRTHSHQRPTREKASKSGFFFNFAKSSKSTERLNAHQYTDSRAESMSRGADRPSLSKNSSNQSETSYADQSVQKLTPALPSKSDVSLASSTEYDPNSNFSKKGKPKPFPLLGRTRSIRDGDHPSPQEPPPVKIIQADRVHTHAPLKTAPVAHNDRSFRDMMSSAVRNHSADRAQPRGDMPGHRDVLRDREQTRTQPALRDNGGGSSFFSGFKSSRAADMISKGLFGKGSRSGSTTEREPIVDDEHYVIKVINQPLVEQTRLTRISKRLEDSRDKTEFWMPAFPWRAIDYLNYKGTDVEGLYRVPGSGPQIKKWQRKFDEEFDVDLFAQDDLYDINIIGSMLKAWLRELPDELFPKEAQERIARECLGSETVPQLLIDELSNLSPFNYYLLFAITCHLSLLLAHADKNKMDFRNLCICFQPCMKIDAFCFKFLVCDWRDCWKGCKNEAKFIEEEYLLFDVPPPRGISASRNNSSNNANNSSNNTTNNNKIGEAVHEDVRNVSSSDSSKQSNQSGGQDKSRLKKKNLAPENGSVASASTISTALTIDSQRETPTRRSGDLRPLSPIKPLSPLGF